MNEIAHVLIKYGFNVLVSRMGLNYNIILRNRDIHDDMSEDTNVRIRMVLQELGTTFIKLGQTLSTYPNLVGFDLADELSKLQEENTITEYEHVKEIVEAELGQPIDEVFEEFSKEPIASASIGQVHTAYLNNKYVAVKVQHKDIEEKVKSDLQIMHVLADKIDKNIGALTPYNIPGLIDVFQRDMHKELDYTFEAMNMLHLGALLKDDEVYVPEVYLDYTTKRVLTMEYLEGVSLNKVIAAPDDEYDKEKIATVGVDSFIKQILVHGFFHADPHPGNIFVLEDDRLAFVDFGMVGHLNDDLKEDIAKLFVFLSQGDARLISKQLFYMGIVKDDSNLKEVEYEIIDILDRYYGMEFNDLSAIMRGILEDGLLNKYEIVIPRDIMMLVRALSMVNDVGKQLCPDFNTTDIIRPYALRMVGQNFKPGRLIAKTTETYVDAENMVKKLPVSLNNIFEVFEDGNVKLSLDYEDFQTIIGLVSRIVNELVLAIIIAALLVGSSLIMITESSLSLFGYPILGFIGFLFSAVLGIVLVILIIMRGNYL
ncbi:MAG: AarF/UbiB family protein [Methanosphaera sp.]|nr:AarF/UbiB family protein [Methanosphaera sp.]